MQNPPILMKLSTEPQFRGLVGHKENNTINGQKKILLKRYGHCIYAAKTSVMSK